MSPDDRLSQVGEEWAKYASAGVGRIVVIDPEHRFGLRWKSNRSRLWVPRSCRMAGRWNELRSGLDWMKNFGKYIMNPCLFLLSSLAGLQATDGDVIVPPGTHIPLTVINSVSTKHSVEGDRVYLQTAFPVVIAGKIAVPPGSYVTGTLTHLKKPGRVKGRGELFLRFDLLTLPNGVVRDFRGRLSAVDATGDEKVEKNEGMIKANGNLGGDAKTIAEATGVGATAGVIAGSAGKAAGMGAMAGASAGAVVGILGVLLSRGPDAILAQGTTIEMVLDRPVTFQSNEINFAAPQTVFPPAPVAQKTETSPKSHLPF